jgi:CheY-like chemotaxis protein
MTASTGGRNAFVVSWDEDDAIALASMLSEAGWIVALEHSDGNRAWKRIKEGRPDIVVVDFSRRPSHSRELLRAMGQRKHTSAIPVVKVGGDDGVPMEQVLDAVTSASASA